MLAEGLRYRNSDRVVPYLVHLTAAGDVLFSRSFRIHAQPLFVSITDVNDDGSNDDYGDKTISTTA